MSQSTGGAGEPASQACSPIQRPFSRNEYRPTTARLLPSLEGRSCRISQTVSGTTGGSAAKAKPQINAGKYANCQTLVGRAVPTGLHLLCLSVEAISLRDSTRG